MTRMLFMTETQIIKTVRAANVGFDRVVVQYDEEQGGIQQIDFLVCDLEMVSVHLHGKVDSVCVHGLSVDQDVLKMLNTLMGSK